MATENLQLAKAARVYIGKTTSATLDADFEKIINENELTMTYSVDAQEIATKEAGKITIEGDESYEFKFTVNLAFTDPATALLAGAKNKSWPYQVRNGDNVWYSGRFTLTGVESKAGTQGVIEGSYTLKNSGAVTENDPMTGLPYGEEEGGA
jgi:hypothetical protein